MRTASREEVEEVQKREQYRSAAAFFFFVELTSKRAPMYSVSCLVLVDPLFRPA
jgi:hypothetical protein